MTPKQPSVEKQIEELLVDYQKYNNELVERTVEEYSKIISISETCNILIIGKTGVGKSTLVNTVFGEEVAEVDVGKPVTPATQKHRQEGCPIIVYDTAGLELTASVNLPAGVIQAGNIHKVKHDVHNLIEKYQTSVKSRIHIIWYCVNSQPKRFEDLEETWVRELQKKFKIPIVLVLTNSIPTTDNKFFDTLGEMQLPVKEIISVLAKPYVLKDGGMIAAFGLDNLIVTSADSLVDRTREIFIQQQIVNIELTEKEALKYVLGYSAAAGAAGMIPIPGGDIPIIIQSQAVMAAHIIHMFGLPPDKDFLKHILSIIATSTGTAATTIASNFLKAIPGIGTLTGEMLSTIAASTLTGAFGTSLVKTLKTFRTRQVCTQEMTEEVKKILIDSFIQEYQNYLDRKNV